MDPGTTLESTRKYDLMNPGALKRLKGFNAPGVLERSTMDSETTQRSRKDMESKEPYSKYRVLRKDLKKTIELKDLIRIPES